MSVSPPGHLLELCRVLRAEAYRHVKAAPLSLWIATLIFPFLTIVVLFHLPSMRDHASLQPFRAALTVKSSQPPTAMALRELRDALSGQGLYRVEEVPDSRADFEAGKVGVALEVSCEAGETVVQVYRHPDFISELMMTHLERASLSLDVGEGGPILLSSGPRDEEEIAQSSRAELAQTAPFILLGFAWFFLTVGAVESFVVERERRTLEVLLGSGVRRKSLAWGKLLYVLSQSGAALVSSALALYYVGFSAWVFALVGLLELWLVPFSVLAFWFYRDMDSSMSASWKNGLLFILGFPALILADDTVGTLSPFYQLAQALEGTVPVWPFVVTFFVGAMLLVLSIFWMDRLVKEWGR